MTTQNTDPVGSLMHGLRDDGGQPLPTTPEALLDRAKGVRRRRRTVAAAATSVGAALLLGGVLLGPAFGMRTGLPVAPATQTPTPTTSGSPAPGPADLTAAQDANMAVNAALYDGDQLRRPGWSQTLFTVEDATEEHRFITLAVYRGPDGGLVDTVERVLRDGGYERRGVQLKVDRSPFSLAEVLQLETDVQARVAQLRRKDVEVSYDGQGLDHVAVATTPTYQNRVIKAFSQYGDTVRVNVSD